MEGTGPGRPAGRRPSRGKRAALAASILALAVIAALLVVARERLHEAWILHRLRTALAEGSGDEQEELTARIAEKGGRDAIVPLLRVIDERREKGIPSFIEDALGKAIGRCGKDAAEPLARFLAGASGTAMFLAAEKLLEIEARHPAAGAALSRELRSEDAEAPSRSLALLAGIGVDLLPHLAAVLREGPVAAKREAAAAIASNASPDRAIPVLVEGLGDPSAAVRVAAARALNDLGAPVDLYLRAPVEAAADDDEDVREEARVTIAFTIRADPPACLAALDHRQESARLWSLEQLEIEWQLSSPSPPASAALAARLADPSPLVRVKAAGLLQRLEQGRPRLLGIGADLGEEPRRLGADPIAGIAETGGEDRHEPRRRLSSRTSPRGSPPTGTWGPPSPPSSAG